MKEKIICVSCYAPAVIVFEPSDIDKIGTALCIDCGKVYQAILKHQGFKFQMELLESD